MVIKSRPTTPGVGFKIGEYVIERELGHGSMAHVYLARDASGHEAAVKIFQEGSGISTTMLERFRREAEATKRLRRHPYILTVYAAGQEGAFHYIAMEHVPEGRTFEDLIDDEGRPQINQVLKLVIRVAAALDYAHENEIVHRDVKPANIMLDGFGEPLLTDFGVCDLEDWPSCTVSGALTGTPLYMSPEQARAEKVDRRSDIYSLGVVLFEALCGELPFALERGPVTRDVLEAVKTQEPPSPRSLNRRINADLDFVMLKALRKSADERYPSAKAFAQDLECALEGRPVRSRRFSALHQLRHVVRRHRMLLVLLCLIAIGFGLAFGLYERMLYGVRAEQMLTLARERSAVLKLEARQRLAAEQEGEQLDVAATIRRAVLERSRGQVFEARNRLQEVAAVAEVVYRDARQASQARLEQARCERLLNNSVRARELYRQVLESEGTAPAETVLASFELLGMVARGGEEEQVKQLLLRYNSDLLVGPFQDGVRCLAGTLDPEIFASRILALPHGFQNDAWLALGLHYLSRGGQVEARRFFATCRKVSDPVDDWPAALADHYLQQLGVQAP